MLFTPLSSSCRTTKIRMTRSFFRISRYKKVDKTKTTAGRKTRKLRELRTATLDQIPLFFKAPTPNVGCSQPYIQRVAMSLFLGVKEREREALAFCFVCHVGRGGDTAPLILTSAPNKVE
jgi:hypothetical protein